MSRNNDPLDAFRKLGVPDKFTEPLSYRVIPAKAISSMTMVREVSRWPMGAIIRMQGVSDGFAMPRAAVFVFATADGFEWVEPSYADPSGYPGHSGHRLIAEIFRAGDVFRFVGPEWRGEIVPYRGEVRELGECMEWFASWLAEKGRTMAQERRRVRRLMRS